ncbi:MAG: hypothetical protein M1586_01025 [Patescibacteria group bacterium]|nr:hypothetical protein [Patescibacteria group bacterium]MCL5261869.1 hypothetical protein [Patescibacteria group bacterium]
MAILIARISFDCEHQDQTQVFTNAKDEALTDMLTEYLRSQMGTGEDKNPAAEKNHFSVEVSLDLSEDIFQTKTDTGNKGLTCGIIAQVIDLIDSGAIKPQPLGKAKA